MTTLAEKELARLEALSGESQNSISTEFSPEWETEQMLQAEQDLDHLDAIDKQAFKEMAELEAKASEIEAQLEAAQSSTPAPDLAAQQLADEANKQMALIAEKQALNDPANKRFEVTQRAAIERMRAMKDLEDRTLH